jgi:uncharacterized membrane protein (UPF0127 family)
MKIAVVLFLAFFSAFIQADPLPSTTLQAGMYQIRAEIAANNSSREVGLMYRTYLPSDDGMLFIFENKAGHCFWMRNTKIPLSIAFIADDGKILNIEDMQAMTESNHCPIAPIRYALEMNQGWFSKKGISAGFVINGLPRH